MNIKFDKKISWKLLLPIGFLLFYLGVNIINIIGIVLFLMGVVDLFQTLVKDKKRKDG